MRKKISFVLAFFLLLAGLAFAQEFILVENEGEPLRIEPGGTIITQIPKDTKMEVVESLGDWIKVKGTLEIDGWVRKEATTLKEGSKTEKNNKIEGGFVYSNLQFVDASGVVRVTGEMTNNSGEDHRIATFLITAYDEKGNRIARGNIKIGNFSNGETKSFRAVLSGQYAPIDDYKIEFKK